MISQDSVRRLNTLVIVMFPRDSVFSNVLQVNGSIVTKVILVLGRVVEKILFFIRGPSWRRNLLAAVIQKSPANVARSKSLYA